MAVITIIFSISPELYYIPPNYVYFFRLINFWKSVQANTAKCSYNSDAGLGLSFSMTQLSLLIPAFGIISAF